MLCTCIVKENNMPPIEDDFFMTFTFHNPLHQRLPVPLDLTGYEVALQFVSLPYNFYNVSAGWLDVRAEDAKVRKIIPAGFYMNVENLVTTINETLATDKITFRYNTSRHSVQVALAEPRTSVMLSPGLAAILRLPRGTIKGPQVLESSGNIVFSGWSQVFYITSNLVVPQMCNGRMEQVLSVISTGPKEYWRSYNPTYAPVKPGYVDTIDINIVSPAMQLVHFLSSSVSIVLHFRKKL
jgi:hypothetical protein